MTTATPTPMSLWSDTFRQVADNYTKTFQAGMKFYEDTARIWTEMATKNVEDVRSRYEKVAADLADINKHNLERFQNFFEEQTRRNASLTPYFTDPTAVSNPAEFYERAAAMWRTSFETLRDSVATAAKANAEMIEGWSHVCKNEAAKAKN